MKKKTIAGLIAIAALVAVVIFAGCIETSPYSVEYSWESAYLVVNITGPADDIAVIVTNPKGDTAVKTISKERMIDNFERVEFYAKGNPPVGTYKFVVKTITPEKVVYETEKKFKPASVQITDAEIRLKWYPGYGGAWGYAGGLIGNFNISVKNDGELPVVIDNILAVIDGKAIKPVYGVGNWILPGENGNIKNEIRESYYSKPEMSSVVIELYSEGEKVASSEAYIYRE